MELTDKERGILAWLGARVSAAGEEIILRLDAEDREAVESLEDKGIVRITGQGAMRDGSCSWMASFSSAGWELYLANLKV